MIAVMKLLKSFIASPIPLKVVLLVGLYCISAFVVGQQYDDIHQPHDHLYSPSVPNDETNVNISSVSVIDDELLPWYTDFLNLPSDGTFAPLDCETLPTRIGILNCLFIFFYVQYLGQDQHG